MAALVYFGLFDDPQSRLDAELAATPENGTRVRDIVHVARRFGLRADARTGLGLDDLKKELMAGAVVIVALQAWAAGEVADWRSDWEDGHYVVVVGVTRDRVYVMDPSVRTGYAYLTRDQFLDRWHDYDVEDNQEIVWKSLVNVYRELLQERGLSLPSTCNPGSASICAERAGRIFDRTRVQMDARGRGSRDGFVVSGLNGKGVRCDF